MKSAAAVVIDAELQVRRTEKVVAGAEQTFQDEETKRKSADPGWKKSRGRREQLERELKNKSTPGQLFGTHPRLTTPRTGHSRV